MQGVDSQQHNAASQWLCWYFIVTGLIGEMLLICAALTDIREPQLLEIERWSLCFTFSPSQSVTNEVFFVVTGLMEVFFLLFFYSVV